MEDYSKLDIEKLKRQPRNISASVITFGEKLPSFDDLQKAVNSDLIILHYVQKHEISFQETKKDLSRIFEGTEYLVDLLKIAEAAHEKSTNGEFGKQYGIELIKRLGGGFIHDYQKLREHFPEITSYSSALELFRPKKVFIKEGAEDYILPDEVKIVPIEITDKDILSTIAEYGIDETFLQLI